MEFVTYWPIVALAIVGVAGALFAFLKTPVSERYKITFTRKKSIAEELASYPESARAVLIKGNKKKAILSALPYSWYFVLLVAVTFYIGHVDENQCVDLFGINTSLWALLVFCYGMPVGLVLVSLFHVRTGVQSIVSGYFPPLESVHFNDTIAKKGTLSLIRGWLLVLLPLGAFYTVYYAFTVFTNGQSIHVINEKIKATCG
jgi:hypothetical protein